VIEKDPNMQPRSTRVSKYLAKYLRHAPEELGLTLQPGGWVPVNDLLSAAGKNGFPITYDELVDCVETNDKLRYSFDDTGDLIRANQGHSVEVDLQLNEREPPDVLFHGTVGRFLPSIMADGLNKGKRHHVHLSKDLETARKVGSRRGKPVILAVDAGGMHRDGHRFYVSANGVWLTEFVPPSYITLAGPRFSGG
jgi:putative RNA 2'-phosphotransferase